MISSDFLNRWNLALKAAERILVELLRKEMGKFVASLDTAFQTSLKEPFSGNVQVAQAYVVISSKHLAESLQDRRNSK